MLAASVYSHAMSAAASPRIFRVASGADLAGRLVLRAEEGDATHSFVVSRYEGPTLPGMLTDPVIEPLAAGDAPRPGWQLRSSEGQFEFQALAVDQLEECPALYEPLHRPFALRRSDRVAVRVLLWLLRVPGGARLLHLWHTQRQ